MIDFHLLDDTSVFPSPPQPFAQWAWDLRFEPGDIGRICRRIYNDSDFPDNVFSLAVIYDYILTSWNPTPRIWRVVHMLFGKYSVEYDRWRRKVLSTGRDQDRSSPS